LTVKKRRGPKDRLKQIMAEPEAYDRIMELIRLGAYAYIVAEAAGINSSTWNAWLAKGAESEPGTIHRKFHDDVMRAQSRARMLAELEVKRSDPKFWLTRGPGKARLGRPGWTETLAVTGDEGAAPIQSSSREMATANDLAATLQILMEIGIIPYPTQDAVKRLTEEPGNGEGKDGDGRPGDEGGGAEPAHDA